MPHPRQCADIIPVFFLDGFQLLVGRIFFAGQRRAFRLVSIDGLDISGFGFLVEDIALIEEIDRVGKETPGFLGIGLRRLVIDLRGPQGDDFRARKAFEKQRLFDIARVFRYFRMRAVRMRAGRFHRAGLSRAFAGRRHAAARSPEKSHYRLDHAVTSCRAELCRMCAGIVIGIPFPRVLSPFCPGNRAGFGPDGAWPAPGVDKIPVFQILSPTTTTTTTTTIAPAGRAGARPDRMCGKALPLVLIFPDISSATPTVSTRLQLIPESGAHHGRRGPAACAGFHAASVSGLGLTGIRQCVPLARRGISRSRAPIRTFPRPS